VLHDRAFEAAQFGTIGRVVGLEVEHRIALGYGARLFDKFVGGPPQRFDFLGT